MSFWLGPIRHGHHPRSKRVERFDPEYPLVKQFGLTNQFEFVEIIFNDIFEMMATISRNPTRSVASLKKWKQSPFKRMCWR